MRLAVALLLIATTAHAESPITPPRCSSGVRAKADAALADKINERRLRAALVDKKLAPVTTSYDKVDAPRWSRSLERRTSGSMITWRNRRVIVGATYDGCHDPADWELVQNARREVFLVERGIADGPVRGCTPIATQNLYVLPPNTTYAGTITVDYAATSTPTDCGYAFAPPFSILQPY